MFFTESNNNESGSEQKIYYQNNDCMYSWKLPIEQPFFAN